MNVERYLMENRKENREEIAIFQERTSRILDFIIAGKMFVFLRADCSFLKNHCAFLKVD